MFQFSIYLLIGPSSSGVPSYILLVWVEVVNVQAAQVRVVPTLAALPAQLLSHICLFLLSLFNGVLVVALTTNTLLLTIELGWVLLSTFAALWVFLHYGNSANISSGKSSFGILVAFSIKYL